MLVYILPAAYKRAVDMNNNCKTDTGDYFVGLLWPLLVFFIPAYLVNSTAKLFVKFISWREKRVYDKKFNKVS